MARSWRDDPSVMEDLTSSMLDAMSMFPKRVVRVEELVHTFHMPLSQIQILNLVAKRDLSIGQISQKMGIAKPNVTPLVDALDEKGYVTRIRKEGDRRIVFVHILPEGEACLREIRGLIGRQIAEWPLDITRSEAVKLSSSFAALCRLMAMVDGERQDNDPAQG
jgi:DNA-binding MarR family transcriptional regulator